MIALAADENFNNDIVRALLRRQNNLNIVRVQDAGLTGADDRRVLEWAASEDRILLTHDVSTITRFAYERIENGRAMPGVFECAYDISVGVAVKEILLLAECSLEGEWEGGNQNSPFKHAGSKNGVVGSPPNPSSTTESAWCDVSRRSFCAAAGRFSSSLNRTEPDAAMPRLE